MHITGYVYFPLCLSLSNTNDYTYLATGCKGFNSVGCEIKVWDIRATSHEPISELRGHEHDVNSCTFTSDGNILSASKDGSIAIWNPKANIESQRISKYTASEHIQYTSLAYDSTNESFYVGAFNGSLSKFSIDRRDLKLSIVCNYSTNSSSDSIANSDRERK
jgi:WD40 repeat protein